MFFVDRLDQSAGLQVVFFPLVGWSAVVLMLGLMDLFATAFISFISKNWQAVKWNFSLDFQLDCLETFVKIFWFCAAAASSSYDCFKGKKSYLVYWFVWVKQNHCLEDSHVHLLLSKQYIYYEIMKYILQDNIYGLNNFIREEIITPKHFSTSHKLLG